MKYFFVVLCCMGAVLISAVPIGDLQTRTARALRKIENRALHIVDQNLLKSLTQLAVSGIKQRSLVPPIREIINKVESTYLTPKGVALLNRALGLGGNTTQKSVRK